MDMSPINTTVAFFGFRGTQTAQELVEAINKHLWPHASEKQKRVLQMAQDDIADANDKLADAAITFGEVKDNGGNIRADSLRAHIKTQHHALATLFEVVAIVANDDDLKERAGAIRARDAEYVEAFEAVLNATAAGSGTGPASATVH